MNQESDSEEEELVVGKVTERGKNVNNRLKGPANERPCTKQMPQCSVNANTAHHYQTQKTAVEERESEMRVKGKTDGLDCSTEENSTKALCGMEVRKTDKDENYSIKPKNLRHSRRRNGLTDSSPKGEDKTRLPTNSKRPRVTNGKGQSASRFVLKNPGRNKAKRVKASKERESSEERELVVGGSFQGERWFDQLSCIQTNGEGQKQPIPVEQSAELSEPESDDELLDPSLEIDEEEYEVDDLVWARHPFNPFWPAIVTEVTKGRQSKITVRYLNAGFDVYTCQYSIRAIRPFIRDRKKYTAEGFNSQQADAFKAAVDEAMEYLEKRALGSSPVCQTTTSTIDCQSIDSPPLTPTECVPLSLEVRCSTPEASYISSPSPELRVGHPWSIGADSEKNDAHLEMDRDNKEDVKRKEWDKVEDRLMKYIFKDTTKERLMKIWEGKIKSSRHSTYFSSSLKERDSLKYGAKLGALITDEKIDRVAEHLNEIFKQHCQKEKDDLPNTGYIFDVWLPEAILFATMTCHRIGKKKAEDLISSQGRQVWRDLNMA